MPIRSISAANRSAWTACEEARSTTDPRGSPHRAPRP
jgi:hypothetical protein